MAWYQDILQSLHHIHDHVVELKQALFAQGEQLANLKTRQDKIMSTLDDILAKQDAALAKATANTDALGAIKTILDANTATIADLKAQLDAAGADPAKLQQLSDNMDKILAAADTQAAAEAALANTGSTPVDPNA